MRAWIRRVVIVGLGAALILDSLVNNFKFVEFILGVVMVGLVPVDSIIDAAMGGPKDEAEVSRLKEVMKKHAEGNESRPGDT